MAQLQLVPPPLRHFSLDKWGPVLPALCDEYRTGHPAPHICLADFLAEEAAQDLASEPASYRSHRSFQRKWPISQRASLPPRMGWIADELNSAQFLVWLSDLTGVSQLVADPALVEGGFQQYHPGESLDLSSGAAGHPLHADWCRRVVLVLYLTPQWRPEWRGAMELWDSRTRTCLACYPSLFNHAVIFSADDRCLFGFPDPLLCPQGVSHRSLVLYYYTINQGSKWVPSLGDTRNLHCDGWGARTLTWLRRKTTAGNSSERRNAAAGFGLARRVLSFPSKGKLSG